MTDGFDVKKFVESFPLLVAADGGPKRLRQLVFDLAVSGRLTAEGRTRGSAVELLSDIDGRRSGDRDVPDVADDEKPRELPTTWSWSRLGVIGRIVGGGTPKTGEPAYWAENGDHGAIPWLTPADLYGYTAKTIGSGRRCLSPRGLEESSARLLPVGSVLFSSRAPIGYVAIVEQPLATNQGFKSVVPWVTEMSNYIYVFLRSAARSIDAAASGTTFREVSGKDVSLIPIPVPPLAEQKRIVAKVDKLMKLIDDLEAKQTKATAAQSRFRTSALDALTKAEGPEELAVAWKRAAGNFGVLFEQAEGVGDLRANVLTLATTGRLVMPATDSAATVRRALAGAGKGDDEAGLQGENGWLWVPLRTLLAEALANGRSVADALTGFPVLRLTALRGRFVNFDERKTGAWTAEQARPFVVQHGDIFFVRGNGSLRLVGRSCQAVDPPLAVAFPDTAIRARLNYQLVDSEFFSYVWQSPPVRKEIERRAKTTAGIFKISQEELGSVRVPLPMVTEQKRIVAKVEALMKLCDDLEAKLKFKEATASKLVEAVVRELVA